MRNKTTLYRALLATAVFASVASVSAASFAQSGASISAGATTGYAPAPSLDDALSVNGQTVRGNDAPIGHLFGIPVVISAPVDAPYNSAGAYSTFAGQPGFGPNAVMAASMTGTAP